MTQFALSMKSMLKIMTVCLKTSTYPLVHDDAAWHDKVDHGTPSLFPHGSGEEDNHDDNKTNGMDTDISLLHMKKARPKE